MNILKLREYNELIQDTIIKKKRVSLLLDAITENNNAEANLIAV